MFYDVHCHLTSKEFSGNTYSIIKGCEDKNVAVVLNGLSYNDNVEVLKLCSSSKNLFASLGMHPTNKFDNKVLKQIRDSSGKIAGIGEVGLDFTNGFDNSQVKNFKKLANLAEELGKPMIVHSRKAQKEVLDIVSKVSVNVVLHAFYAKKELLSAAGQLSNIFFSIPASVSYDNQLKEMVKLLPLGKLLCETDSPYLWKFGTNTPLNVIEAYKIISSIKGVSLAEAECAISRNFNAVFIEKIRF